jgi:hypothetical protein
MTRQNLGRVSADVPQDWIVDGDSELIEIHAARGKSIIQISTYRGSGGREPSAAELWEFAEPSIASEGWRTDRVKIREITEGFALDVEGPTRSGLRLLMGYRLWAGRLLLATYTYSDEDASLVPDAKAVIESLQPEHQKVGLLGRVFGRRPK